MTKPRLLFILLAVCAVVAFVWLRRPQEAASSPGSLRIVSLAPNVTEILFALGLGDHIVGATDQCNFPPAARQIPRVSGFGMPNVEKLLALAPDMVVACGLEKPEFMEVLRRAGIRVVNVQEVGYISGFQELFDAISRIGEATGRTAEAQSLITGMKNQLAAVAAQVGPIDDARRTTVFVEIEESPLMTAGAGSFLDDLIHRAGGRNVAHEISAAYPRINPERVVAWNPQVILVAHGDRLGEAAQRLARRIGWSNIAAVRKGRIIDDIDPDWLFRPGPRLVDGVKALANRIDTK